MLLWEAFPSTHLCGQGQVVNVVYSAFTFHRVLHSLLFSVVRKVGKPLCQGPRELALLPFKAWRREGWQQPHRGGDWGRMPEAARRREEPPCFTCKHFLVVVNV